jgi:hypothetical protein
MYGRRVRGVSIAHGALLAMNAIALDPFSTALHHAVFVFRGQTVCTGGLDRAGKATWRSLLPFFLAHRRPAGRTPRLRSAAATPYSARYGTTCIASRRRLSPTTNLWRGSSERKGREGREADAPPAAAALAPPVDKCTRGGGGGPPCSRRP